MEVTATAIISLVVNLVLIGIAWGNLKAENKELFRGRENCMDRFKQIENKQDRSLESIDTKIQSLSSKLDYMIGQFEMYSKYVKKDT